MSQFDRHTYLERCRSDKHSFSQNLPIYGVVTVVVLCMVDLILTLIKIAQGPFIDANPIAQALIENGFHGLLIALKLFAVWLFAHVCTKNRHLLVTKIGVALATVVYIVLTFHWTIVF